MNILMNASMMPSEDYIYSLHRVSEGQFVSLLTHEQFTSYIGYPQTAEFLSAISGIDIPLNREKVTLEDKKGNLLVVKLVYRVQNPTTKGKQVNSDDFEFFVADYYSNKKYRVVLCPSNSEYVNF